MYYSIRDFYFQIIVCDCFALHKYKIGTLIGFIIIYYVIIIIYIIELDRDNYSNR